MGNKKASPRYPIRIWLGKFESWLLIMKGRSQFRAYDKALERLFAMFPNRTGVEQFLSTDISDYIVIRKQQGKKEYSLMFELNMFYSFWKWLLEDQGLPIHNPVRAFKNKYKPEGKTKKLGLAEVNLVLDQCSPADKRIVIQVIGGGKSSNRARKIVRDAASKVGLVNFDLGSIRLATKYKLSREIIQAYCQQLLDTLPSESKLDSNAFATIEGPPLNEGSPVCHGDYHLPVVNGVNEQEPSPKGQSLMGHC